MRVRADLCFVDKVKTRKELKHKKFNASTEN
jgi:hypothetical protein